MPKPQSTAQSSPRMWGCFYGFPVYRQIAQVFPTHVGVFPGQSHWDSVRPCLPHACGGVSLKPWHPSTVSPSSPRMWGCFCVAEKNHISDRVFPTHVGVFPILAAKPLRLVSLPHACGGVSAFATGVRANIASSPRMWGCFLLYYPVLLFSAVFPTHVGVFLCSAGCCGAAMGLPHACGGVSGFRRHTASGTWSSPRMWGCFWGDIDSLLWSLGLPHACGGVSESKKFFPLLYVSSPRMWGCFLGTNDVGNLTAVFPTHVGVFLLRIIALVILRSLPHACGGVSFP